MNKKKHDCYNCKHRKEVTGSAHTQCGAKNIFDMILEISQNKYKWIGYHLVETSTADVKVSLHETGVKNGWAIWPLNFDPVWIDECKFFEEKV